jgi:hypothetical protein
MINQYTKFFKDSLKHLNEKTAAAKRGIVLPTIIEQMRKYQDKGYFVHFSNIKKVGIFPKSGFFTPIGFYTYPLTRTFIRDLENGHVPFASDRKYIMVVKQKPSANILKVKGNTLSENKYIDILNKLFTDKSLEKYYKKDHYKKYKDAYDNDDDLWEEMIEKIENEQWDDNVSKLWGVTRVLANGSKQWGALFRALGIDGVDDSSGTATIHPSEPIQAVFFHKGVIDTVDAFHNKYSPEAVSKRKERKELSKNKKTYLEYREKGWPVPGDTVKFTDKFIKNRDFLFPGDIAELTAEGAIQIEHELSDKYNIYLELNDVEDIIGDTVEILELNRFRYVYDTDHLGEPHSELYENGIMMDMLFNPYDKELEVSDTSDGDYNMKNLKMVVKIPSSFTIKGKEFTVEFENPVMKSMEIMDLKYEDNAVEVVKKGDLLDRIK